MKKAVILGARQAGLVDVPEPQPIENWVVVKVHAAPMCAEYKQFVAGTPTDNLGHEAAGEVVAVAQPGRVKVGDRVVAMPLYGCGECALCRSGNYIHCEHNAPLVRYFQGGEGRATYAQYLLKQDWLLMPIPDDVSYQHASLACCGLGPSYGAMQRMGVSAFDTVLIAGAGPVGLGAIVNARYRGARAIVVESIPYRVERAQALGAEVVLDPRDPAVVNQIKDLTEGRGADASLDCAGVVAAQRLCIDATRRMGKMAFVGECQQELPLKGSPDMIRKGLTLIGSWHYNLNDYPGIVQVIRHSPLVDTLISHSLGMSCIQEAFKTSASNNTGKMILDPWR
jgi:L-iditol 2-dehydrogenase